VQLSHLEERNARRNANLEYLSQQLEPLGCNTFIPPAHVQRVYFEYLIRVDEARAGLSMPRLIEALKAEGCDVQQPRYPLLHQQPLFTEGAFTDILRLPSGLPMPVYKTDALPRTESMNRELIRLPASPQAEAPLLDQYALAFRKVFAWAREIAAKSEAPKATHSK
jgi:perosamine synthetase